MRIIKAGDIALPRSPTAVQICDKTRRDRGEKGPPLRLPQTL
jgi:hypothetical protein